MTGDQPESYRGLRGGQYKPLSDKQVALIHQAALDILAKTGVAVTEPQACKLFAQAGAQVDGERVRIPPDLVMSAVEQAPSDVVLAGRDPKNDLHLGGKRVHLGTGGAALQVLDLETGVVREAVHQDIADTARLIDALPNIHFYVIPVYPTDLSDEIVEITKYYTALANTTKHVQAGAYTVQGVRDVIEMAELIMGGAEALRKRPIVSFITSWVVSPLNFATDVTTLLIEVCRQGVPVVLSAAPIGGLTAPVTLAGMLAQTTAEQLAGLTLTQLVNPGCPVIIGPIPTIADMRTGKYLAGTIELGLCNAAVTQMAHFYRVPIYNSAGMTDSKIPDIQAGMEKMQSIIQVATAGSNYIHHAAGMLEDMSTVAYEQYVLDNEMIGLALRALRGIEVNEETLALEVIDRVGPGGHYLLEDHTLAYMRTEHYYPSEVFDRQGRDIWQAEGRQTAWERAKAMARDLLATHQAIPIDPAIDARIRARFDLTP